MPKSQTNEKKRNISFHIVSAIREAMNIAKKSTVPITYEQAFDTLFDLDPILYDEVIKDLPQQNQNETAKLFVAKAQLLNEADAEAKAIADLREEINQNEILLNVISGDEIAKNRIKKRQYTLAAAIKSLEERKIREHRILQRDFSKINREDFGAQFLEEDDYKVDYLLGKDSYLRIRLLHPENMEAVTGADLIYEQQDLSTRKIRVMFLQYKIWDENGVMYFSQGSLEAQLRKMKVNLCDKGFCNQPVNLTDSVDYRFPYCSCFLRPTDPVQNVNTKLMSSGIHIPVCAALSLRDKGALNIDKKDMRSQSLTHTIFEPLFNKSFVGSRWLTENELKQFYIDNGIMDSHESLMIYAREIIEEQSDHPF